MEGSRARTRTQHSDLWSVKKAKPRLIRRILSKRDREYLVTRRQIDRNELEAIAIETPAAKRYSTENRYNLVRFARKVNDTAAVENDSSTKAPTRTTRPAVVPDSTSEVIPTPTSEIVETPTEEEQATTEEETAPTEEETTPTEEETTTTGEETTTPGTPEDSSAPEPTEEETTSTENTESKAESPTIGTSEQPTSTTEETYTTEEVMSTSDTISSSPKPTPSTRTPTVAPEPSGTPTTRSSTGTTASEAISETPTTSSRTRTTEPPTTSEEIIPTPDISPEITTEPTDSPTPSISAETEEATTGTPTETPTPTPATSDAPPDGSATIMAESTTADYSPTPETDSPSFSSLSTLSTSTSTSEQEATTETEDKTETKTDDDDTTTPTTSATPIVTTPETSSQTPPTSGISTTPSTSSSVAPITPTDTPTTSSSTTTTTTTSTTPPPSTSESPSFSPLSTTTSDSVTPTPPTTTTFSSDPFTLITTSFTSGTSTVVQTVTITDTPIPTQSSVCINYGLSCGTNAQCVVLAGTPTCVCSPGFVGNGTQCREVDCSVCPDGTFQTNVCSATADRVCTGCTSTDVCTSVSAQCTPTSDTVCQACKDPSKVGLQCQLVLLWVTTSESSNDVMSNYATWSAALAAAAGAPSSAMQSVNVTSGPPTRVYVGFARPYDLNLLAAVRAGNPEVNQLRIKEAQEYGQSAVVNPTTNSSNDGLSGGVIAGIACGIAAVIVLIGLCVFLVRRRRKSNVKPTARDVEAPGAKPLKKGDTPLDPSGGYSAMIPLTATQMPSANTYEPSPAYSNTSVLSPRPNPSPNPAAYANANTARPLPSVADANQKSEALMFREELRRQEGPIPPNAFVKLQLLGEGAFGAVYQGALKDGDRLWPVAVKEMKSSSPQDVETFRAEANLMKHLSHANVVSCIGATSTTPLYILLELMPLGDLAAYLQKSKQKGKVIGVPERLWYGFQIARGMAYLAGQGIVHRDLAARNCMLAEPSGPVGYPVAKISDFGLSRQVDSDHDYYRMESTGKVPVPWLAPETLKERIFSERTDVWAYGITMWEVWTDCSDMPYAGTGINLFALVGELDRGYRLPQPPRCPPHMYALMRACWAADATARPPFTSLAVTMAQMFVPVSPYPVTCSVVDGETVVTEVLDRHGYVAMDQYDHYARMQSEGTDTYLNSPYIKEEQLKAQAAAPGYDTPNDTLNPSPRLAAPRQA